MKSKVFSSPTNDLSLHILGINSTAGIAFISAELNRHLDMDLRFYTAISARRKNSITDQMAVFTNYQPKSDLNPNQEPIDRLENIHILQKETPTSKYMLVQAKGESLNLFPRIRQIDYVFLSNYPFIGQKKSLQSIPDIRYIFDLYEEHLGAKLKYFRGLMQ